MDKLLILKERVEKALKADAGSKPEVSPEIKGLIGDLWGEIIRNKIPEIETVSTSECGESFCLLSEAFYAAIDGVGLNYQQNVNFITSLLGQYCSADFVTYNKLKDDQLINIGEWAIHQQELDSFDPIGKVCYNLLQGEMSETKVFDHLDELTVHPVNENPEILEIKTIIGKPVSYRDIAVGTLCVYFKKYIEINQNIRILLKLFSSLIALEEIRTLPLSETEEKLRILINATPDIICFKDEQNRWMQANDSMLEAFSLQNVDYAMKSEAELSRLIKPLYIETFYNCIKSDNLAWETGSLFRSEEHIPKPNGVDRIFDIIKVPLYNEDQSRKGLVVFGRDITQWKTVQQQTSFLNQSALGFLQMEDDEDIYAYIAERVRSLLGEGIVMVASFDESVQIATLRSIVGFGPSLNKALNVIGRSPVGMTTHLGDERKKRILDQSFTQQKNLYETLNGALNASVCKTMEKLLSIGKIYEMGFAVRSWLLGDVTIFLPKGTELDNRDAIEALVKMAAVALHQKQVKLSLMESEESYKGLFNCMNSAAYILNEEFEFLDVNEGALKMYGYPRERFIGQTPDFLSAPGKNDNINIYKILKKTFNGEPGQIQYWGIKKDGTVFPKDIKFYKGVYFGQSVVLAVADDITERYNMISEIIEARDEAEQNMRKTQSIVMAFPDLIMVIDEEGHLIEALSGNDEYAAYFSAVENRKNLKDFVPTNMLENAFENIRKVILTGEMEIFDFVNQVDGQASYFEIRMVKYNSNQVLAVIRDITQRVLLIQEIKLAKDKAEESARLKTAFLHNISHEIRTPLNGIVGFSNLLAQPGIAQGDTSEYVSFINTCSDQLLSIINDIVNIATLEAGQEEIHESEVHLNKMMRGLMPQFFDKASNKGLEFSFEPGLPDDNCLILTDETKLLQLFSNLIGNSIKFTKVGSVRFGYIVDAGFIEFFVQDTGVGIPEDMHEVIFDRFRQVNNTLSMNTGGTGLGLSISRSYVELMGGRIWLKSIPGEQTVFYFTIPYKTASRSASTSAQPSLHKEKGTLRDKVILVAEDEEINYRLIKGIFSGTGVHLIHVYNGADAVEKCKSGEPIDLVLMDLKMDVMDGYTAAGIIRQMHPELPIIAQSAFSMASDKQMALEAGCNDYISKPLRKANLFALLEKYLTSGLKNN